MKSRKENKGKNPPRASVTPVVPSAFDITAEDAEALEAARLALLDQWKEVTLEAIAAEMNGQKDPSLEEKRDSLESDLRKRLVTAEYIDEIKSGLRRGADLLARGIDVTLAPSATSAVSREEALTPILRQQGLTTHGWALQAGVDFHTADDYLKGKTTPYPNTLKNLADALGITVADMPK